MSIPNLYLATFTPAGTVVSISPPPYNPGLPFGTTFALPAVDANNLDLLVTNGAASDVSINFAGGNFTCKGGQTTLLTAVAATVANTANPLVLAMQAAGSSAVSCQAYANGGLPGVITIQRGTAVSKAVF